MLIYILFCSEKSRLETIKLLVLAYLKHEKVGQIQVSLDIPPIFRVCRDTLECAGTLIITGLAKYRLTSPCSGIPLLPFPQSQTFHIAFLLWLPV